MSTFYILEKNDLNYNFFKNILGLKGHKIIGREDDYNTFLNELKQNGKKLDYIIINQNIVSDDYIEIANQVLSLNPKLRIIFVNTNGDTPRDELYDNKMVRFLKEKFSINALYLTIDQFNN
jgi:two-component SAPR family response regulator